VTAPFLLRSFDDEPHGERRTRILDAAERCFVRAGFHRTTMQDVAAEARMSPGNLYRYFPSKDAMAAGLAERDRAQVADDFNSLVGSENFLESFAALGRKHFEEKPREKAILCLEIWAEATRNPTFAAVTQEFERDVLARMEALFRQAQENGLVAPEVDVRSLAVLISTLADGLFVRRAILPNFAPAREVANVMAVLEAAFAGKIALPASTEAGDGGDGRNGPGER
jgi:TetR/AcrR family transcriptional regulator, repressor for uid operon